MDTMSVSHREGQCVNKTVRVSGVTDIVTGHKRDKRISRV